MPLQPLKPLASLGSPMQITSTDLGFLPGGSGGGSYGVDLPSVVNPVIFIPPGASGKDAPTDVSKDKGVVGGPASDLLACMLMPGTCLLRLVFLVLGLIAVIGAIYLYKPSWVVGPAKAGLTAMAG